MIIDDEEDMCWILSKILESEGYETFSVQDGSSALALLGKQAIDLVLLDIRLPHMDGMQILETIKKRNPDLPVIMITGYGSPELAAESIKKGAFEYLPKPFANQQVIDIVRRALEVSKLKKEKGIIHRSLLRKLLLIGETSPETEIVIPKPRHIPLSFKIMSLSLALIVAVGCIWMVYQNYFGWQEKTYPVSYTHISGIAFDGEFVWTSDWFSQDIYQHRINPDFPPVKIFHMPGTHLSGITCRDGKLFTCNAWDKKIFRHNLDNKLTILGEYSSPGPNPSGLFWDGKHLWSCDADTCMIYRHNPEDLAVNASFPSPGPSPVGLFRQGNYLWSADSGTMRLYKHSLKDNGKVVAAYPLSDKEFAAFTMSGKTAWIAVEGQDHIYSYNIRKFPELTNF